MPQHQLTICELNLNFCVHADGDRESYASGTPPPGPPSRETSGLQREGGGLGGSYEGSQGKGSLGLVWGAAEAPLKQVRDLLGLLVQKYRYLRRPALEQPTGLVWGGGGLGPGWGGAMGSSAYSPQVLSLLALLVQKYK